jgi:pyruvate kinase
LETHLTSGIPDLDPLAAANLLEVRERLAGLRRACLDLEAEAEDEIALVHPERRAGARNLVDYLALRQSDIRDLQKRLHQSGLSSLGVVQGRAMASLNAVIRVIDRLCGVGGDAVPPNRRGALEEFTLDTLGPAVTQGSIRIMVTMPSEAAHNPSLIESLVEQGMTIMRVNCAHDGPEIWGAMVRHLDAAKTKLGKPCRVAFDLAGPKLRTGPLEPGPEVVRLKPERDNLGKTVAPAPILFGHSDKAGIIPVDTTLQQFVQTGDEILLTDTRGRERLLPVVGVDHGFFVCTSDRTTYLASGMNLDLMRVGRKVASGRIGKLPSTEAGIVLSAGDALIVTRDLAPGRPALLDDEENVLEPARIGCTLAEVFDSIAVGHRVLLDDGKFEGAVTEVLEGQFRVGITRAGRGSAALKAEKGINLPDTRLALPALTSKDIEDLKFVVQHGDMVSFSFVRSTADIDQLYEELRLSGAPGIGVVLKIENRAAFDVLPQLLMSAAKRKRIAVMVARGDLGVEIGFERMAEVQEEILWLCEAAEVPVIWATQVLESLAKNGLTSRGEVTDAAMSVRAECVMLNKGPYIGQAIRFLTDVSNRMRQHASKTFATHRALSVAGARWLEADRSKDAGFDRFQA